MQQQRFILEWREYIENGTSEFILVRSDEYIGLDDLKIEARRNNYAHYEVSAVVGVKVRGNFAAAVKHYLITHQSRIINAIECRVFDTHNDRYLHGFYYITNKGIKECRGICDYDVSLQKEDRKKQELLNNEVGATAFFQLQANNGLKFFYCVDNGWQYPLAIILSTLSLGALLSVFGTSKLLEKTRGCNHFAYCFRIRDYIKEACAKYGYNVDDKVFGVSTSLNAGINNANIVIFNLGVGESEYTPLNMSFFDFLEWLRVRFRLKWQLSNNTLLVRYKDEPYNTVPLLGFQQVTDVCCEFQDSQIPAYGDFTFAKDASDTEGEQRKFAYGGVAEYNKPYSIAQKGVHNVSFLDAPVAHRNDGLAFDKITNATTDFAGFLSGVNQLPNADNFLMIEERMTTVPKLLMYDIQSPKDNATTVRRKFSQPEIDILTNLGFDRKNLTHPKAMFTNYPLLCNPTLNDIAPNTYEKHKQDNPRISTNRDKKVCTLKMPNCRVELLEKMGIFDGNYPIDWVCDLSIDEMCEIISFAVDFGRNEISFEVNKI